MCYHCRPTQHDITQWCTDGWLLAKARQLALNALRGRDKPGPDVQSDLFAQPEGTGNDRPDE